MIAATRYAKTQNETASKERLMMLLFEKALRDLRAGAELIETGRAGDAVYPLTKASDIVVALRSSLKDDIAPEVSENLGKLYDFCAARITLAATARNAKPAREAERVFAPIVDAFAQAVAQGNAGRDAGR